MFRNYLKIALRGLVKNKGYSAINIGGLALGMSVAILIGLWIHDELSFDKHHKNYDCIAKVMQFVTFDVEKVSFDVTPIPMAEELRNKYPEFEKVSLLKGVQGVLGLGEKKFEKSGFYVERAFLEMMTLKMLAGSHNSLEEQNSILLSESMAKAFFGTENPLNKLIKFNNKIDVRVTGTYEDFPDNSSFNDLTFLLPWELLISTDGGARRAQTDWDENSYQVYAQLKKGADFGKVSAKIKDVRMKQDNPPGYRPEFFLQPMSKWHLRSEFKNGVNTGGLVTYVWLFGIIGVFVLLLACINFMNLSTARSEKRAKEVGIRKAVGSMRAQLVKQFFSESFLVVLLAFGISLLLALLIMPFFNEVAAKKISIPWSNAWFWLAGFGFSFITGVVAGSYPAFYLSSFQPIRVLKGGGSSLRVSFGRFAALPRKVLVVLQFTVSVTLIIGTIVIFRQINHAKNRPVGYNRNGLIEVSMSTDDLYGHFDALRNDLLNTGSVKELAESSGSVTIQYGGTTDISWPGKKPDEHPLMKANSVSHEYGKTVGWKLVAGRDFSRNFSTDSAAIILNQTAVKVMGLKKPLETLIRRAGKQYRVIGIVQDMIKESPFAEISPSFFVIDYKGVDVVTLRLAPEKSASESISKVEKIFKAYSPASPFEYKFVDQEFGKKFGDEERIGKLATSFAILAIFISCLGLFGLASFVAEQRTKEIGVRKVLGATVANLWQLLSKDFVVLVIISCFIAGPVSWYFMNGWLKNYTYHTEISWWIFAATALGALGITLLTVSFQAIRAALMNPVKSLRSE
ncbi:ABC transporter permease [Dyadobacter arcticus]|uniref:ABC-type antimicrobial peptide transport system permease subunit n=1 Tax=Dyadobacter arcticus TaxID=1078754 RepID=A0ABX0UFQ2_9BACT|nr:ABC transporter permease [Dyadobacter arcticus]NIJ51827.1 ABC-type antimicrobial peptide transport system permease subunit [Dyadobacter arcticus]